MNKHLTNRRIAILATDGFEQAELEQPLRALEKEGAEVSIVSPKDGANVPQTVVVKFAVENIALAPAGDPTKNTGHHHLLIDVDELPAAGAPIPKDANHQHFGAAQTQAEVTLTPGKHTLQLELGDSNHMPFDPPIVSEKITVNVK